MAGEWAGIETVAFCEREAFCQKVLKKHWPHIPIYDDVCTLTKERLEQDGIGTIDLIHGGYPCQPFSHAGKREGANDDRHLWPEVKRLLETIRPRWFVGENVAGHITLGLDDVLSDLEDIGYTAQSFVIPACAVNAPHRRDRVFIVAHSNNGQCELTFETICTRGNTFNPCSQDVANAPGERRGEAREYQSTRSEERTASSGETLTHTNSERQPTGRRETPTRRGFSCRHGNENVAHSNVIPRLETSSSVGTIGSGWNSWDDARWSSGEYKPGVDWWAVEPDVGRVANGVSDRIHRLKALGNAVVPQQIYPILAAIKQIDDMLINT